MEIIIDIADYNKRFEVIRQKIEVSQARAALSVNKELLIMYWMLGEDIVEMSDGNRYGKGFYDVLSRDLNNHFPDIKGFSAYNLRMMARFFKLYEHRVREVQEPVKIVKAEGAKILEQPVPKLEHDIFSVPWGHHIAIIKKTNDVEEALFYVEKTVENNWTRAILLNQLDSNLHKRNNETISNYSERLPESQKKLGKALLKDPYIFDFLTLSESHSEHELEKSLIENIKDFLLELGSGFAFVGNQYKLIVGEKEYRLDLLFYHLKLRCYVVIELKITEFIPEYAGKMNFYLNAVDDQLKQAADNDSIGIIICKTKDNIEAEYSIKGMDKPIGVAEYTFDRLPPKMKELLPSNEEIIRALKK